MPLIAYRVIITGQVQGVGFRPHVYRLALALKLSGWVCNRMGLVDVHIQGHCQRVLDEFLRRVIHDAPPLAVPRIEDAQLTTPLDTLEFCIRDSLVTGVAKIYVPVDKALCDACLTELYDPQDRRFRYPFINCTQCGPRYTIILNLPYDRATTTMAGFPLCAECGNEYTDPTSRRFHAEPIGCPNCGPSLSFHLSNISKVNNGPTPAPPDTKLALQNCVSALRAGKIIAIRGIGGYHLCCAADQEATILRLRQRKSRPHKPLAVMFPAPSGQPLQEIVRQVQVAPAAAALLLSATRPVVLVPRLPRCTLSPQIAPGLKEIGVFLPYSPLHQLILQDLGTPLVATSANLSGEPVLTDPEAVEARLGSIADGFLHHNRPIARPADDPVYRTIGKHLRPLRLGRGNAPLELALPFSIPQPLLATGGHSKNTVALAWEDRVLISPHIGDLDSARGLEVFTRTINDLQRLYRVDASLVLCDAHPEYASSKWAQRCGLPWQPIFHHHAHAAAVYGEARGRGDWLVFTWDGWGLGDDDTLQGGEAWLGQPGQWHRFASWRPFFLPGGIRASHEPWRSAAALCWATGREVPTLPAGAALARHAWERRLNSPKTTAVGRLFDAAAALIGLCQQASFDGQAPMLLEAACSGIPAPIDLPLVKMPTGTWVSDWEPLVPMLLDISCSPANRAAQFHSTLAHGLLQQALQARKQHHIQQIGLAGGVFQNKILTELVMAKLTAAGFEAVLPSAIPVNDAGLSYGQIIEASQGR